MEVERLLSVAIFIFMRCIRAAAIGCVLFTIAGCVRDDCTQARGALERVAGEMHEAWVQREDIAPSAFADRMEEEVGDLDIEHPGLRKALGSFVAATRDLAERREARDEVALEVAQGIDRLRKLRDQLETAYDALGEVCEEGLERCLVHAQIRHIVAGLDPSELQEKNAVELQAERVRSLMEKTSEVMHAVMRSEGELIRLKSEVAELEHRAAGLGLQVGAYCSE